MTYIEKVPQPFLDDLLTGQVIPFIGAGLSLNAIPPLPSFSAIGRLLASQIQATRILVISSMRWLLMNKPFPEPNSLSNSPIC